MPGRFRGNAGRRPARPSHPADPGRCHVEDGPAISVTTAQMIACSSSWSWMLHDSAGKLLDLGRRRRRRTRRCAGRPGNATRAGAGSRAANPAGWTCTTSSTGATAAGPSWTTWSACANTTTCSSTSGYLIATTRDGTFAFYHPDGTAIPASPPLPQADGTIGDCHDADITTETIVPAWYGERLDLDYAIYVCLANAQTKEERQADRDQAGESGSRDRVQVFEPEGWADRIREYYAEHVA